MAVMDERPVTYLESLKISWLVTWRFSAVTLGLGIGFGFLMGAAGLLLGLGRQTITAIALAGTLPLMIFAGCPLVVRMMLRKRFEGFRLRVVRDEKPPPPHPAEPFGGGDRRGG